MSGSLRLVNSDKKPILALACALACLSLPCSQQSKAENAAPVPVGVAAKPFHYADEKARLFDYVYLGKFVDVHKTCQAKIADGTAKAYHYQASALARLYPQQALPPKAVRECLQGLEYFPDDIGLEWTLAVAYARNLQWAQALRRAMIVLDKDPQNVQALAVKAICLHRAGREDPGLVLLRRALAIDPGNQELNMLVVFYARLRNKFDDAYVAFDRWNQLNPRSAVGFAWRGEMEYDDSKQDAALKSFKRAVDLNPDHVTAVYKLAKMYYNRQDWTEACRLFLKWEKMGGHNRTGIVRLSDCLLRTKQYKEAVRICTMAMEIFKDSTDRHEEALGVPGFSVMRESSTLVECQVKRAIAYFYSGDTAKAIEDVQTILREHPDNVPALDLSQKIAFKLGNYSSAVVTLSRLIDIDRDVQMWYQFRADAYKKLGKTRAAADDLKIVDALNKTGKLPTM